MKKYNKEIVHYDQVDFIPEIQEWFSIHKLTNETLYINVLKDKNHMIISINAKKPLSKSNIPFIRKSLEILEIEGMHLNIIEAIYDKHRVNLMLSEDHKAFPLKSIRQERLFSLHQYKRVFEELAKAVTRKGSKLDTNRMRSQSLSIYRLYDSIGEESPKCTLENS